MKKALSIVMAVVLLLCAVPLSDSLQLDFSTITASAADDSQPLTWSQSNNMVTITACDTSYSGTLIIPDSINGFKVYAIGDSAFSGCTALEEVVLPETVYTIGRFAFQNCRELKNIYLPENLTTIEHSAFIGCSSLKSVSIPDGVKEIKLNTFYECSGLESVSLPQGITSIGQDAFIRCTSLKSIELPTELKTIAQLAFCECSSLTEITVPDSVAHIGTFAFSQCANLKYVKLSSKITEIKESTFRSCRSLSGINIPPSVKSIGDSAFYSCFNLRNVIIHGETDIDKSAFRLPGSGLDKLTIVIDGDAPQTKELVKQYGTNCVDVDYDHGEKVISFNGKTTVYAGADYSYITNCAMEHPEAEYLYFDKLIFDGVKNDVIISDEMTFVEPDAEDLTFNHLYVNMKMITEDGDKNITFEKMLEEFEKGNYDAFKLVVKSDEGEHEQSAVEKFIGRILTDALNAMSRVINFFARLFKRR